MPIRFKPNNDLRTEPVVLGLRVSNIGILCLMLLIGLVAYGILSGYIADAYPIMVVVAISIVSGYFILRRIEKRYDTYFIDKWLASFQQPKFVKAKNYKHILKNGTRKTAS